MKNLISKLRKNGFYIILFLCLCAIGISGYVMFKTPEIPDIMSEPSGALELEIPELNRIDFEPEPAVEYTPVQVEEEPEPEPEPPKAVSAAKHEEIAVKELIYKAPVEGEIIVPFSGEELIKSKTYGDWRTHSGVDIAADEGTKVHAMADGTVKDVYEDEMMGHTVIIEHKPGTVSAYSNLMKGIVVKKGDKVNCGDVIGGIGSSAIGECMEPAHLHIELTVDGEHVDPMSMVK